MTASTGSSRAFSSARAFEPGMYRTLRRGRMVIARSFFPTGKLAAVPALSTGVFLRLSGCGQRVCGDQARENGASCYRYVACAAVERKRRIATRKNRPPMPATSRNCGQTTSKPAPR